ncbi:hypothetical protein C8Q78DRAFT_716467 [Trametes maxima]|nr:hypothetical protein C8Q78DRAFT_716467 [Trametes maxima]
MRTLPPCSLRSADAATSALCPILHDFGHVPPPPVTHARMHLTHSLYSPPPRASCTSSLAPSAPLNRPRPLFRLRNAPAPSAPRPACSHITPRPPYHTASSSARLHPSATLIDPTSYDHSCFMRTSDTGSERTLFLLSFSLSSLVPLSAHAHTHISPSRLLRRTLLVIVNLSCRRRRPLCDRSCSFVLCTRVFLFLFAFVLVLGEMVSVVCRCRRAYSTAYAYSKLRQVTAATV